MESLTPRRGGFIGATGETQAKLLRQIETLQTQYAAASENWHTLEGLKASCLASVEKERDDAGRREIDLRGSDSRDGKISNPCLNVPQINQRECRTTS